MDNFIIGEEETHCQLAGALDWADDRSGVIGFVNLVVLGQCFSPLDSNPKSPPSIYPKSLFFELDFLFSGSAGVELFLAVQ
ncbi:hypothetical protein CMV_029643 [Castanea mollissima]|uniref:Uncharacterized protein n=1 Tax=Castanea mollissima TaxID=60419 RepID=A0A8J4QE47_9ROSI|nr:hypothetical protein CMV_029643 [Castanea mollissima]